MHGKKRFWMGMALLAFHVGAQEVSPTATPLNGPTSTTSVGTNVDATPKAQILERANPAENLARQKVEQERFDAEILAAKVREPKQRRFAEDLFQTRQLGLTTTDGGISEEYVLGVGDQLQLTVVGSANFEMPLLVDGRGGVVIPKVGTVPVTGMSLGRARSAIQAKVGQLFSRSTVDLSVTKFREVRVFILGEVYRPGGFLIPNLSSIVNVLGMAGGPSAIGSFREIRILRGGKVIHVVDLYPLRSEGLGNLNFGFQGGDTVFVPLCKNLVRLEGAFTRVVAGGPELNSETKHEVNGGKESDKEVKDKSKVAQTETESQRQAKRQASAYKERGDHRLSVGAQKLDELTGQPTWLIDWFQEGVAPTMQFEMREGETVQDAVRFAGGFAIQAFAGSVSLRRISANGAINVRDVPAGVAFVGTVLENGDALTALPLRDTQERAVTVSGWSRVQGVFSREDGVRVGDLLKRMSLVLPETYLERAEIVRTLKDGTRTFMAFNVTRAMAGEAPDNILLQDRDRIEIYRTGDLRVPETLHVVGPVTRPGAFEFIKGMRAADLLFRAGVLLKNGDRFIAELAHTRKGKASEVVRLDLTKLLSSDEASPVNLLDNAVNPLLEPFDQISLFARPDFRYHRTITLTGQVQRPGVYEVDHPELTVREVIARAGGLTERAMPSAAVYLRPIAMGDPEKKRAGLLTGTSGDPTANGINGVLTRLNETKRMPVSGLLISNPLLHGLMEGSLDRLIVNFPGLLAGDPSAEVELQDGDEIIIPMKTAVAYVVGETASPFAAYKVAKGMKVHHLLALAGGPTRNADVSNIRLLKADGRIVDSWVSGKEVEAGDALLVPQRIRRDVSWQENLAALTPLAIMIQALRR